MCSFFYASGLPDAAKDSTSLLRVMLKNFSACNDSKMALFLHGIVSLEYKNEKGFLHKLGKKIIKRVVSTIKRSVHGEQE